MAEVNQIQTVGRRKRSVARVLLRPGSGKWTVNGREMQDYFPRPTHQIRVEEPLKVTELEGISGDGDSGGPAFVMTSRGLELAGLSAFQRASGARLGKYGATEVYTRVSQYQDFVDETTGDAWDGRYQKCSTCATSAPGAGAAFHVRLPRR